MDEFVVKYLESWGLEEYKEKFASECICESTFTMLTEDVIKELIPKIGPRLVFTKHFKILKQSFTSENPDVSLNSSSSGLSSMSKSFSSDSFNSHSSDSTLLAISDSEDVILNGDVSIVEKAKINEDPSSDEQRSRSTFRTPRKRHRSSSPLSTRRSPRKSPKKKKKKSNLFKKFANQPVIAGKLYSKRTIAYPGSISYPFPLSSYFRKYLSRVSKQEFCEHYSVYKSLIRELHSIITVKLGRNPTSNERKLICCGLVREYPILGCGFPPHSALSEALRKRGHNQSSQIKKQLQLQHSSSSEKSNQTSKFQNQLLQNSRAESSSESNDAQSAFNKGFKQRRAFVTSLDGKVRSKETFSKYPEFRDANTCLLEMASILKTDKESLVKNAEKAWQRIFDSEVSHLKGKGAAEVLHGMLKNQSQNDEESYVLQTSEVGQMVEGRKEKNQPFILCAGSLQNPGTVSITIDCNSLVILHSDDPLRWFLVLYSLYYILDLAYPAAAQNLYQFFENKLLRQ